MTPRYSQFAWLEWLTTRNLRIVRAILTRHLALLILALTVTACACGRRTGDVSQSASLGNAGEVRVTVATVGFDEGAQSHFVLLTDNRDRRVLPIMIGQDEAQAIALEMRGIKPQRPLTHDLLNEIISRTGNHVDRVEISNLHDEIYYAKIFMDSGKYAIDSRPSDAIALAIDAGAPIYVASNLFESESGENVTASRSGPKTAQGLGMTVEEITPALAMAFDVAPNTGVVVTDDEKAAQSAGIVRGDIVTRIGSQPIRTPADFSAQASNLTTGSPIVLTINRSGSNRTVTLSR